MIDGLHVGANHHAGRLLIDHLAPRHPRRVIGLHRAHIRIKLPGPLIPPVGEIHFRAAGVLLLTGHPLENPLALQLDGKGIGKIDDPFARVFHCADGEEALRRIVDAGSAPLRASPRTVDSEAALRARPAHSPIEIHQAVILKKLPGAGRVAARHPAMKAAVIVGDQFAVLQVDWPPRPETNIMRDRDQVRLVLHRAQSVLIEVDQQLFSGEALSWRHSYFVATVSPHLHPVGSFPEPARRHLESRCALQRGDVPDQQAVAGVAVPDHVIHRVHFGSDQVDDGR